MRPLVAVLTLVAMTSFAAEAREKHRQLGAHQHGHGQLSIAVDGQSISMELRVSGDDIVGFEHRARTKPELQAVEAAKTKLSDPLALFKLPEAAGCRLKDVKLDIEDEEPASTGARASKPSAGKAASGSGHKHGSGHSEFHAVYALECAAPAQLTGIEFSYFSKFAKAQSLNVTIITNKSQAKHEVTRRKPRLALSGIM